jgi:hypothetical protein
MAAVTALWPYGGPGRPYGSFEGKTENVEAAVTIRENTAYEVYIKQANGVWEHTQIVFTGADFGVVR